MQISVAPLKATQLYLFRAAEIFFCLLFCAYLVFKLSHYIFWCLDIWSILILPNHFYFSFKIAFNFPTVQRYTPSPLLLFSAEHFLFEHPVTLSCRLFLWEEPGLCNSYYVLTFICHACVDH